MSKIIFLEYPTHIKQHAFSTLLEGGGLYILFNCTYGVLQTLLEIGVKHNSINHLVLSNIQPEQTSDLLPFLHAGAQSIEDPRTTDLHIYGPPGVSQFIDALLALFELNKEAFHLHSYSIVVHEFKGEAYQVGPFNLDLIKLPFNRNFVLQIESDAETVFFLAEPLLEEGLHFNEIEVNFLNEASLVILNADSIDDEDVIQIALKSQCDNLVVANADREINVVKLEDVAFEMGYSGKIIQGHNLMTFQLDK